MDACLALLVILTVVCGAFAVCGYLEERCIFRRSWDGYEKRWNNSKSWGQTGEKR